MNIVKTKKWISKPAPNEAVMETLRKDVGVNDILLSLMVQRGVVDFATAKDYFLPQLNQLHPPFLMKGMDIAVKRIHQAIQNNEKILVYGDYDVDGTTAVATVYAYFSKLYDKLTFYIPDRFKEGYGISPASIEFAYHNNYKLIVALDCGIKSVEIITEAKEKGIDFIICDHHKTGPDLPPAVAILNPKQDDCPYPYKHLSGCGIGFKLIQAYSIQYNLPFDPYDYLDYTAVSIASDIVPVTGENRIMAFHGLKVFNSNPKPGFKALMDSAKITGEMNVNDLIFKIGPRINAAGRIASGTLAVKMLVENDLNKAEEYTKQINIKNVERQTMDKNIFIEARKMVLDTPDLADQRAIVLFNPGWHKGVIGIVASRLIEEFHRPTVMLTESNGVAVGSARSVPGYDLYTALDKCSDYLEQWGGHTAAAGLTMKVEKIKDFQAAFEQEVRKSITADLITPIIEYDLEVTLNSISPKFCQTLERFGPFGPENNKPVFITRDIYNSYNIKLLNNAHLSINISDNIKAIGFNMSKYYDALTKASSFDLCYTIEPNMWRNEYNVSLYIMDIVIHD